MAYVERDFFSNFAVTLKVIEGIGQWKNSDTGVGPGKAFAWVRIINFISIFRHNIKVLDSVGQETSEFIVSFGRLVKL